MSQAAVKSKLKTIGWQEKFAIDCYGETLNFRLDDQALKPRLLEILPVISRITNYAETNNILSLVTKLNAESNNLYFNDEVAMEFSNFAEVDLENLADKILIVLAKISLPTKFYIHAGAVVWKGHGILIPGESYSGKTTLVKELIEAGAEYYSDDCIILCDDGYMLPLPRPLAIRTEAGRLIKDASEFGAKIGKAKAKLDAVIFTAYDQNSVWNPQKVSVGQAVLELMDNFYYKSSIGDAPGETIRALTKIMGQTKLILGGKRNEAAEVIRWIQKKIGGRVDNSEL